MIVESFPDRTILVEGKEYLYFGGTAYLGLPTNYSFQNTLSQSIAKWGSFYGSSRNANVKLSIYNKAERLFATQIGAEDSVTVSSGTLAGKLVLEHLSKSEHIFYHHPKTHPAILHSKSLPVIIEGRLHPNLLSNTKEEIVIAVDAVLAQEVEPTALGFLNHISSQKKVTLLIDESHSLGIVGKHGEGVFNTISIENLSRKIMVSSFGKALGLSGGIIASDKFFIDSIKNEALFVSSSCANPAYLEAYILSQDVIKEQRKKLEANLEFLFKELVLKARFKFSKNYPVIYSEDESIYSEFLKEDIIITNFKYPTYKNAMNRIVITANHTQDDLSRLKKVLNTLCY